MCLSRWLNVLKGLGALVLVLGIGLTMTIPAPTGEPKPKPLTDAQKAQLKERDRLRAEADKLDRSGKLTEAAATLEKVLAIERQVFGNVHKEVAASLNWLAGIHEDREDFKAARKALQEVLTIRTQLYGAKDWRVTDARLELQHVDRVAKMDAKSRQRLRQAMASHTKVGQLYQQGQYKEALPLARQVQTTFRELLTENHPDYATSLNNLAELYRAMGAYTKALPLCEQARDLRKKLLSENHPDYAQSLNNLAALYRDMGDYAKALPLLQQARDLYKKLLSENHPHYATSLHNLALLYQAMGDYAKALPLYEQARDLTKKLLTENHPAYAQSLNNLAALYWAMGDYAKALPLYEQARDLRKKLLTENHPDYAQSLNNLAGLYQAMGDYGKALPLSEQARDLYKKLLTENHPRYATSLHNLAVLYQAMGDYAKALPLSEQARDLRKKLLTENHPDYAQSLDNLALLYQAMGDYGKALPLSEQARDLYKKLLTENHPDYAISLNNLAGLYQAMNDYAKALPLLQQARDLYKKLLTENHPDYATSLNNLAALYKAMGDYAKALPLYEQARDLRKKLLTENHPAYAQSLNNLALLCQAMGDYAKALPLLQQARDLYKKLLTENHPDYAISLSNLATQYLLQGQPKEAAPLFQQALTVNQTFLDLTFSAQGERQRLAFLRRSQSSLHGYLSVAPAAKTPASTIYQHVLPWKATLALRQAEEHLAQDRPALQPLLAQLHQARAGLAHLSRTPPKTKEHQAFWLKRFDELETEKENLEVLLAQKSDTFRRFKDLRHTTAQQVAQTLPAKTVLVEFLAYGHASPSLKHKGKFDEEERLLAFVLARNCEPVLVPLGSAEAIAKEVQSWRQAVGKYQNPDQVGAELRRRVWEPLRKHRGDATTVLLAPDGPVSGLPFAALPGSKPGSYLIEEVTIGYVTSGRHLLELDADTSRPKSSGLLALGGLSYGKRDPKKGDAPKLAWSDLPGTRLEVERLAQTFRKQFPKEREPLLLQGDIDAPRLRKELTPVKETPHWRYLHLATHGFFEPSATFTAKKKHEPWGFAEERDWRTLGRNPMLLSGLVLAGANQDPGQGTLAAEEVLNLDLRGCELVVLSACQTGLGKDINLEGVMGLRRAFQASGAKTLVVSLWNVNDAATAVLMDEFYANLWQKKKSKLQALHEAQLTVLRNPGLVQKRIKELREVLAKRGLTEAQLEERGLGKKAGELPGGGKIEAGRSPLAWWAPFILSGEVRETADPK
jgi:tetratricopeptide (TPR) repeat protein/CHAT domain-containing protein